MAQQRQSQSEYESAVRQILPIVISPGTENLVETEAIGFLTDPLTHTVIIFDRADNAQRGIVETISAAALRRSGDSAISLGCIEVAAIHTHTHTQVYYARLRHR